MLQYQQHSNASRLTTFLQQTAADAYPELSLDDAIRKNVYFLTLKFNRYSLSAHSRYADVIIKTTQWYSRLLRQSFGKHIGRVIDLQPRGYLFADFDGTRQSGGHGGYQLQFENPHVHGVLMIMPGRGQEFRETLLSDGLRTTTAIEDTWIEQFDPDKGSLEHLTSYCMKGYQALPSTLADREEAMCFLPHVTPKKGRPSA